MLSTGSPSASVFFFTFFLAYNKPRGRESGEFFVRPLVKGIQGDLAQQRRYFDYLVKVTLDGQANDFKSRKGKPIKKKAKLRGRRVKQSPLGKYRVNKTLQCMMQKVIQKLWEIYEDVSVFCKLKNNETLITESKRRKRELSLK